MPLKKLDDRAWIWKHSAMLLLAVLAAVPIHARAADFLSWNELTGLPPNPGQVEQLGVAGSFVGVHNHHLIVAGSSSSPSKRTTWNCTT